MSDIDTRAREAFAELFGPGAVAAGTTNAPPGSPNPPGVPPVEKAAESAAAKAVEAGKQKEPEPPAFIARALARVADRERAVAAKERELAQKAPTAEQTAKWTKASIRGNLSKYLKDELGLEPAVAGRALMNEILGDKAPPEYRQIASQLREGSVRDEQMEALLSANKTLEERLAAIETRDKDGNKQREDETYQARYLSDLEQHMGGDLTRSPSVAALFGRDRERCMAELRRTVVEDARAKLAAGVPAEPMTPAEAVSALEKYIAELAAPTSERKTLAGVVPGSPVIRGSGLDDLKREADDWLAKQSG